MPTNSKVGVSDIAKHAGVSIGTVSNYLNYPERVSETLKAKIGAAIQELGYVPRRAAPSPAQTTTGTPIIGYVMTDIEHSLFSFIFEGAQEVCEENGMQIIGLAIGTIVAYIFGTAWLAIEAHLTFYQALLAGVIPYIPGDLVKIILVVLAGPIVKKRLQSGGFLL